MYESCLLADSFKKLSIWVKGTYLICIILGIPFPSNHTETIQYLDNTTYILFVIIIILPNYRKIVQVDKTYAGFWLV